MSNSFYTADTDRPWNFGTVLAVARYDTSWHSWHGSLACFIKEFARGLERLTWITQQRSFFLILLIYRVQLPAFLYASPSQALRAPRGAKDTESITIPYSQRRNGPCKFPPPHRRRFSLIADRSPCWVINVSYGDRRKSNGSGVKGRSRPEEENNQMERYRKERERERETGQQTAELTDP